MPTIQQLVRFERVANKKKRQNHQHLNPVLKEEAFVHVFIQQLQKSRIQLYVKLHVYD
jgi:hypothetical protein